MHRWRSISPSVCPSNTAVSGCQGSQMNGFAALDIHPHRRYVVDIGGRRSSRCRLHINFALFLHSLDFTQNLGLTREESRLLSCGCFSRLHFALVTLMVLKHALKQTKETRQRPDFTPAFGVLFICAEIEKRSAGTRSRRRNFCVPWGLGHSLALRTPNKTEKRSKRQQG